MTAPPTTRGTRAAGLLCGIAAGDKNGGPQRLAYLLARAVYTQLPSDVPAELNVDDVWDAHYARWFAAGGFDTGVAFEEVYAGWASARKRGAPVTAHTASAKVHDAALRCGARPSVGVGAAHRNAVLACFPALATHTALAAAARSECALTHHAPLARHCAAVVNLICREIIVSDDLSLGLAAAQAYIERDPSVGADDRALLRRELQLELFIGGDVAARVARDVANAPGGDADIDTLTRTLARSGWLNYDGFAPPCIRTALWFVAAYRERGFRVTLDAAIAFAGPPNFCPVVVGSIAGAMQGAAAVVASSHLTHALNRKVFTEDAVCLPHLPPCGTRGGTLAGEIHAFATENLAALWVEPPPGAAP